MARGRFVTIVSFGEEETHMACPTGEYATLCGMDGDDNHHAVDQHVISAKANKITCRQCINIWDTCREYKERDIKRREPNE